MNFPKIAQQVIEKLGGKENIATAAHCATRLRIVLHTKAKWTRKVLITLKVLKVSLPWQDNIKLFLVPAQ